MRPGTFLGIALAITVCAIPRIVKASEILARQRLYRHHYSGGTLVKKPQPRKQMKDKDPKNPVQGPDGKPPPQALLGIGLIDGSLGLYHFSRAFPPGSPPDGSTYEIVVGVQGPNESAPDSPGGEFPEILITNRKGQHVGWSLNYEANVHVSKLALQGIEECDEQGKEPRHDEHAKRDKKKNTKNQVWVYDGTAAERWVPHSGSGAYMLMMADYHDVCISRVVKSFFNEETNVLYETVFSGDIAAHCGAQWAYSFQYFNPPLYNHQAKCFWIDADGTHGHKPTGHWATGFQVYWPAYETKNLGTNMSPDRFCNHKDFRLQRESDSWTVFTKPLPLDTAMRRSLDDDYADAEREQTNREYWAGELALSDHRGHSAREVCESETYRGPSLAQTEEGLFCEVGTRTLYELCGNEVEGDCFDVELLDLSLRTSHGRRSAGRAYRKVHDVRQRRGEV